jgi:hypothetical protein
MGTSSSEDKQRAPVLNEKGVLPVFDVSAHLLTDTVSTLQQSKVLSSFPEAALYMTLALTHRPLKQHMLLAVLSSWSSSWTLPGLNHQLKRAANPDWSCLLKDPVGYMARYKDS